MKMLELSREQFEDFVKNSPYKNYCQTKNYGEIMSKTGFEYSFIGYSTNGMEILAAGMFLTKKIGSYYYAYCPKGYILDYQDSELVRKFTNNIIKYYKRKNVIFLKINPEVHIANIDYNNDYMRNTNSNISILENLKKLGFKKRKEIEPFQLLQPKLNAIIDLKEYDVNKLDKKVRNKINSANNKGLELEVAESSDKIEILYEFIKNMKDRSIDYYKNFYNEFKKTEQADLLLVKVNFEKYLINAKQRVEEEETKNYELNEKLKKETSEKNLKEKMNSDKVLEDYKQDIIYAREGLKKKETTYVAGAIVIKYEDKISIIIAGVNKNYNYLNSNYFLHNEILNKYKEEYALADINGIADDFKEESKFSGLNKFKIGFNPTIKEYIGELDLVISKWKFKIIEKNNLLSNEFTKKKDITTQTK